jgi:cytochrome b6-f complex iron-sulfur subunit
MPDEQETPKPETPKTEAKERRVAPAVEKPAASGGQVVAAGADGSAVVVMQPAAPALPAISRRKVLLIGFWAGIGAMLAGIAATIITTLYPRGIKGFGSTIFVGTIDALEPGKKIHNLDAKTWLVRLDAEQAKHNPPAAEGSVIALYHKCPHLGCTVPYRPDFSREDPRNSQTYAGWFLCPCHGSTYSDAGVRVFGPAPRSMDTFPLTIKDGKMTVNTGKVITGSNDNPSRAILPG